MGKSWSESFEAWAKLTIPNDAVNLELDARFTYDPQDGVVLDFMAPKGLSRTLCDLTASITGIGIVTLPEVTFQAQSSGLNNEYRYKAKSVLVLGDTTDTPLEGAVYASSDFPNGEDFLGHDPFTAKWTEESDFVVHANSIGLSVDWGVEGASLDFETSFRTKWSRADHHRLEPLCSFSIEHSAEAAWHDRVEELNRIRAMLDFLAFRPFRWSIGHLRNSSGDKMSLISQALSSDKSPSSREASFLSLSLKNVHPNFGDLLRFGFTESWRLSSFGEISGLIRFPSRGFEHRLFTALRALEVRDGELRPGTTNEDLVTKFSSFDVEWGLLGISDIRAFRWLLRNTRNYLAHLTASPKEPPLNENDRYRAYFQSVAACRASILRAGGAHSTIIEGYMKHVGDKCLAYYGAMDFSHYPKTPDWVKKL